MKPLSSREFKRELQMEAKKKMMVRWKLYDDILKDIRMHRFSVHNWTFDDLDQYCYFRRAEKEAWTLHCELWEHS